jgi:hypothetical protein
MIQIIDFLKSWFLKSYTFDYKVGLGAKSSISLIIVRVIFGLISISSPKN